MVLLAAYYNARHCIMMQFWVVAWLLPLFPHLPRLPLIPCVLGERREAGSNLGHLLAIGDGVEVPLSLEVCRAVFLQ